MENTKSLTLKDVQNHLIKTTVGSVLGATFAAIVVLMAFYYNTNNKLDNHELRLQSFDVRETSTENKLNNIEVNMGINNVQQTNLDKRMSNVEQKVDAIYNLLVKMNKAN